MASRKTTQQNQHLRLKPANVSISNRDITGAKWDVIVIGTGMGGSAAGGICALHGLKTLILDKNPRPGGSCSFYEKQGFHIDTGTHLFIRGNNGPFGALTRRLGLGTPINFLKTPQVTQFRGMNVDIIFPESLLLTLSILPKLFWQLSIPPAEYKNIFRLLYNIYTLDEAEIERLDSISVDEFIYSYTKDEHLRSMLSFLMGLFFILPTWEASAGESIWNMQYLFKERNLSYPEGGAVTIPKTFLKGAAYHGAAIRLGAGVSKIKIKNGKVASVVLDNGDTIKTKAVISTTALKDTVFKLAGADHFPRPYADRVKDIKSSMIAVQAKIAVRKKLVTAGSLVGGTPLKVDWEKNPKIMEDSYRSLYQGIIPDFTAIYAPIPTNYDPKLAPEGCQIITACAAAPTLDIPLQDKSEAWIDRMMAALYQMIPLLKENIIFCDTWSIPNIACWIGKSDGAAITTGQTPDQIRCRRPSHKTPVSGLYIAGDCGGPARGIGTELACQSGMDCGDLVANDFANHLL